MHFSTTKIRWSLQLARILILTNPENDAHKETIIPKAACHPMHTMGWGSPWPPQVKNSNVVTEIKRCLFLSPTKSLQQHV
jgi:hypothetical protein